MNAVDFDSKPSPKETPRPAPYPISGYFISSTSDDARNFQKLRDVKAVGGDTVITFGNSLVPTPAESLPADCIVNGDSCAGALSSTMKINKFFTFSDGGQWGETALKCPQDRSVDSRGKTYTILAFPTEGEGCRSPTNTYDVVVAGGSRTTAKDPTVSLAHAASELNMKFFAGMPAPAKRNDIEYLPDLSYSSTLQRFTERFLEYQAAKNDVPGLAGFYHHLEMPVSDNPFFEPILSVYTMQNEAIHRILPTRSALISPYIEARRDSASITPQNARAGIRKIAATASRLELNIAIQDGMGTGKGAAFLETDAAAPVDEYAASIVGKGTWKQRYVAPNKDYFDAAAAGIRGTGAILWANLEGMAPAIASNDCDGSLRGQTTLPRIDSQLQQLGKARKIVSYMWDPYFTCEGQNAPLKDQLADGFHTSLITDTVFDAEAGVVRVSGFNLAGHGLHVEWTLKDGSKQQHHVEKANPEENSDRSMDANPRLETVTLDVGPTSLRASRSYNVGIGKSPELPRGTASPQGD
ncbi:DUF4434 domain-containing protein [Paenarthrobacter sp. NyZ202]|uniref:DUF4434 domain-containing protein n=1 Tax=Paenarthrobacter sp. NyZ202 TaxID=3402689 RepID=UPI003CEA5192